MKHEHGHWAVWLRLIIITRGLHFRPTVLRLAKQTNNQGYSWPNQQHTEIALSLFGCNQQQ